MPDEEGRSPPAVPPELPDYIVEAMDKQDIDTLESVILFAEQLLDFHNGTYVPIGGESSEKLPTPPDGYSWDIPPKIPRMKRGDTVHYTDGDGELTNRIESVAAGIIVLENGNAIYERENVVAFARTSVPPESLPGGE